MRQPGEGVIPYKQDMGHLVSVSGVRQARWYMLGCPSSKSPHRELCSTFNRGECVVQIWFFLGVRNISRQFQATFTKQDLGISQGLRSLIISNEHPPPFPVLLYGNTPRDDNSVMRPRMLTNEWIGRSISQHLVYSGIFSLFACKIDKQVLCPNQ